MKRNLHLLIATLFAAMFVCSCSESAEQVGTLVLSVDKNIINLDEQEKATFTVTYNGKDVTDEATIVNISFGGYEELSSTEYTSLRPGNHTFFAYYDKAVSEFVGIYGSTETNLSNIYYRRNMIFKFTATWCTYCPNASVAITSASSIYPNRLIEMAIHSGDELEVSGVVTALSSLVGGVSGYPTVCVDANKSMKSTGSPVANTLVTQAQKSMADFPTTAGIKLESKLDGNKLTIDVENHFTESGNYKLVVAFLQSGYNYSQTGTTDENYRQNHVVRWFHTSMAGDYLGENDGDCIAGERVQNRYETTLTLTDGAELTDELLEKFEIVAYVLKRVDDATYQVNNCASVGVGTNTLSDYQYEPILEE